MKTKWILTTIFALALSVSGMAKNVTISKEQMMDKIKGAWAGQVIGCTYGGPTEFRWQGMMIPDTIAIKYNDHCIKWHYDHDMGLYDDLYMDLCFLDVMHREGIDAPVRSHADAFANAGFMLWHANQAARYNILQGVYPPESGHWLNNPHADDIDYQIEADYAGIITPGMPNEASRISDKIGHIMNYGDGWYGGVFVGAMYSTAYFCNDVETVVSEALKTIPSRSRFYKCIADVIRWHKQYPTDWKRTWRLVQGRYSDVQGCPDGVMRPFNIDAVINSAYIVIGLLYGEGDFAKTLEISTRCGQDSDCNPASAGGVLGCMMGYSKIPECWMKNLYEVEDRNFAYTDISLNKAYDYSLSMATELVVRNGGRDLGGDLLVKVQKPKAVRFEQSFPGMKPIETFEGEDLESQKPIEFTGCGITVAGSWEGKAEDYVARIEIILDGKQYKIMEFPTKFHDRCAELCWIYGLEQGKHTLSFKHLNPNKDITIWCDNIVIYGKTK
ncbi:MAG: ADP-ribosylglycohydrolase family protein [Bacteroidales bacterium]|nr:ADP-ribosylglycohydrolase family protein [Candidatus Sodaliphilus aphodohippi]